MRVDLDESDRQFILLGLAVMSLDRPGFADFARTVATKFQGLDMLESFISSNRDERKSRIEDAFSGIVGKLPKEPAKPTLLGELQRLEKIAETWYRQLHAGKVTGGDAVSGIQLAISDRLAELQ